MVRWSSDALSFIFLRFHISCTSARWTVRFSVLCSRKPLRNCAGLWPMAYEARFWNRSTSNRTTVTFNYTPTPTHIDFEHCVIITEDVLVFLSRNYPRHDNWTTRAVIVLFAHSSWDCCCEWNPYNISSTLVLRIFLSQSYRSRSGSGSIWIQYYIRNIERASKSLNTLSGDVLSCSWALRQLSARIFLQYIVVSLTKN